MLDQHGDLGGSECPFVALSGLLSTDEVRFG